MMKDEEIKSEIKSEQVLKVNEAVEAKEMDVEMNDVCMNNQVDQDH